MTSGEVVRGAVADEEALVEWFLEHRTCIHDSHIEHLGACAFCLARWLIHSDWLATYTAQHLSNRRAVVTKETK